MSKIDKLWALEIFVRVAESGSFSRAAESLNLANATLTASVRNLEHHLGVVLISRDTRRIRLTEEGQLLLPRARQFLQSLVQIEEDVRGQGKALSGSLHIEVPISLGQGILASALPRFAARFPDIVTTVTLTNQPHNLIERAIDVTVRADYVADEELIARALFEARYVICGTADLVASLPECPEALNPRLCMSMLPEETRFPMPWEFRSGDKSVTVKPTGPLHFNNAQAAMNAAASGIGLVCVLDLYAEPRIRSGELVRAFPGWSLPARTWYVVTTKDRAKSPKVRVFIQFLLELLSASRTSDEHQSVPVRPLPR